MLCCFSGTTYDVITFLICIIQKREYLQREKRYAKKKNDIFLYSEEPFKQAENIFYFIGTLRKKFNANSNTKWLAVPGFQVRVANMKHALTYLCGAAV